MTLFATLAALAIVATIGGFIIKQNFVIIIGALFWFLFAAQAYTLSTGVNDVFYLTFFVGMFIGLVTFTSSLVVWRRGRADIADYTDDYDDMDEYQDEVDEDRKEVNKVKRLGKRKKKKYFNF